MKNIMKIVLLFVFTSFLSIAQTVDGQFTTNVNGSILEVTVSAKMQSGSGSAGILTINFTYNQATLSFPASPVAGVDYVVQGGFAAYPTQNVFFTAPNTIRFNFATFGSPVPLSTTYTSIVKFNLGILVPAGSTDLIWTITEVAPAFGNPNYTTGNWPSLSGVPLPVELTSFTANQSGDKVILNWKTATEVKNAGFDVERKGQTSDWKKIGFIKGKGNSNQPSEYTFKDLPQGESKLQYRLKQVDVDGQITYSTIIEVKLELPKAFGLDQNYPNPFNPTTSIRFQLPQDTRVSIKVYNLLGQEVATILNQDMVAGYQSVSFDASRLSSGTYIYRLEAGKFSQVKKMMLLK